MKDKRTPRPMNLTQTIIHLRPKQEQIKIKEKIEEEYIKEYIMNDFHFLGNRYTLEEYSYLTNIPLNKIQRQMAIEMSQIGLQMADDTALEGTLRAMVQQLFMGALGNRAIAQKQYSILAKQQQDEYVPFLTSALNQSIQALFQADNQTLAILKALLPSNGLEALLKVTNPTTQGNGGFTASQAVELLKNEGPKPLLEEPKAIEALEQKYQLDQMPEVVASRQSGIDTSKEGLDFKKIAEVQLEAMNGPEQSDHHQDRRAHEYEIDLDNDDNI